VRWTGPALDNGRTVHVGNKNNSETYLALYTHDKTLNSRTREHKIPATLNHIGIVVTDIDKVEERALINGLRPNNHANYKPGRRFYFDIHDNIEIEVVSYAEKTS